MTDIVKVKQDGVQVYPQTHANAVVGLSTIKGETGPAGPTGPAGTAATITVGTVTSGDTAAVTNAGTSAAAKFNFVLPRGPQGATGPAGAQGLKGDTGPQGPAGQNATTTAVATTTTNGLMASTDKSKLDGIAAGAQKNPGAATSSAAGLMSAADKTKLDGLVNITFEKVGTV